MARPSDPTTKWKVDLSDFKASMQEAARQIKLANSEFKAATAGAEDWAKSTDGLAAKIDSLKKVEEAQQRQLAALQAEYKRVSEAQGEDSKAAENLKIRINNQEAAVKTTQAELGKYEKALNDVGKETEQVADTTKESADGFTVMKGALADIISNAVQSGVKALASAFVDLAKGIADATVEAAAFADDISTQAKITGLSTDALQEYAYMAELVDVDVSTLTGAMSKLLKTMISAKKGTGDAADAFKELGVQIVKHGELRDSREVFLELIDALGQIEDTTYRDSLAMAIFGKSAQELNPLILAGSEELNALADEAHRVGAVLSGDALDDLNETQDAFDRLGGTWEALKKNAVAAIAPALNSILTPLAEIVQSLAQAYSEGGFDGLIEAISEGLVKLSDNIAETVPDMIHKVLQGAPRIVSSILGLIPQITAAVFNIAKAVMAEMPAYALEIAKGVPVIVRAIKDALLGNMTETLKGFKALVEVFTEAVSEFLQEPELPDAIAEIVQMIIETLLTLSPELINAATEFFVAIIDAIPIMLPALMAAIPQIAEAVVQGLIKAEPAVLKAAEAMYWAVVDAVDITVKELIRVLPSIPKAIAAYFTSIEALETSGSAIYEFGYNLGLKLGKGLWSTLDWLKQQANTIAQTVLDALLGPFGGMSSTISNALTSGAAGVSAMAGTGQTGQSALTGLTGTVFNMTVNSPKALSAYEIYQQTNNLLFAAQVAR